MRTTKKTVLLGVSLLLGGCVSMDRIDLSRLKPMHSDEQWAYFLFEADTDAVYKPENQWAEDVRMQWLAKWIEANGYDPQKIEVTDRQYTSAGKGPVGTVYYTVRVGL